MGLKKGRERRQAGKKQHEPPPAPGPGAAGGGGGSRKGRRPGGCASKHEAKGSTSALLSGQGLLLAAGVCLALYYGWSTTSSTTQGRGRGPGPAHEKENSPRRGAGASGRGAGTPGAEDVSKSGQQAAVPPRPPSKGKVTPLMAFARKGDVGMMAKVLKSPYADALNAVDQREMPAVFYALEARHHRILEPSRPGQKVGALQGQYEDIVELLASHPKFDGEVGNPIYYAVHFRNLPALQTLLKHTKRRPAAMRACLTEVDAHHETVLHVSARSKSAGFTRLFITTDMAARRSGDLATAATYPAFRTPTLELLGARLPAPAHHGGWMYSASDLTDALSTADLEMLLAHSSAESIAAAGYSGNTPLHVAALSGYAQGVRVLLKHGADPAVTNDNGHNPLHMAAIKGFTATAEVLVQSARTADGLGLDAVDKQGRTALYLASEAGFVGVAKVLLDAGADGAIASSTGHNAKDAAAAKGHMHIVAAIQGKAPPAAWVYPEPRAVGSEEEATRPAMGWDATPYAGATLPSGKCPFQRIDGKLLTAESFADGFLSLHRPVIIDGLLTDWPATTKWTKGGFLKHYGEAQLSVGKIPYAATYGFGAPKKIPAKEFIAAEFGADAARSPSPNYVFDAEVLHRNLGLQNDAPVPEQFPFPMILQQFILGPRGSGAYPHFHNAAINALVHGRKRWWLFPPDDAFFTLKNVSEWMEQDLPWLASSGQAQMFECMQEAGQVLYVPEQWGHAVLNVQDSVAVAFEFHE